MKRFISYTDTLITAMNARMGEGLQIAVPKPHPCALRTPQIEANKIELAILTSSNVVNVMFVDLMAIVNPKNDKTNAVLVQN